MTVKRVSAAEADLLIREQGYAYVDVRSIPEFQAGHPAGAYNVPIMHKTAGGMQPNGDFVRVMAAIFPKDAKLILGCRSGNRSLRAAQVLIQAGYQDVIDQRGGTSGARDAFGQLHEPGWEAAGLAVSVEPEPNRNYEALRAKADG